MLSFFDHYAVPLESHPVYLLGLSPIEHSWTLLKQRLRTDFAELVNNPGGSEKVKGKLAEVLSVCWEKIPPKPIEALWRSMPSRVHAVIDAKGRYTRY